MHHFRYENEEMHCESVPISSIAGKVGTPFYLYSVATLKRHFRAFDDSFKGMRHLTCFSMKSNSNMAILKLFAKEGGGVDIVSGGELYRALKAGVAPENIVYSGVGKREEDIRYALQSNILMFNVESRQELYRLNSEAEKLGKRANMSMRVNPDVDPQTHPYISTGLRENKFGVDIEGAVEDYRLAAGLDNLNVSGISCHIGSQLTKVSPFVDTLKRLKGFIKKLERENIRIRYLDIGGGLGITYKDEVPPLPMEYAEAIKKELNDSDLTLILEPGRVIVGNAGILVTKVLYTKSTGEKNFIVVDAAMNDLVRPSLYGSFHGVQGVRQENRGSIKADIVGPICETGDFLAKDRDLPAFKQDDLIAVMSAGAYGFSMSSTYNSRPRVAEVMVNGDEFFIIRERETYEDLIRGEHIPEFLNG
ncbi:MAG: diaminopimelate decarboxylase [Deltaproteobacteria bacterium]|nr:diaminopimelate decarboxylase [Deltaproteobacteria bacterium]